MPRLGRYLKPFLSGLLLTIVLLFGQAICDLSLPNYMSDIVNTGIQQSGVQNAAPDALSEKGMILMTTFMSDDEKEFIRESYTLVLTTDKNANGETYGSLYPKAKEQFYVKMDLDEAADESLDYIFGTAALAFTGIMGEITEQRNGQIEDYNQGGTINIALLYQMQPYLSTYPEAAVNAAREKALVNDKTILIQSGIAFSKSFYDELGFDLRSKQADYIFKIGLLMLFIALLGGAASVLVGFLSSKIATGVARDLRKKVFEKVAGFSSKEFDEFSGSSLITRCTNDVMQIQHLLIMGIRLVCYAPIMGVGGIIMAVSKSASMSWTIAVAVICLLGMIMIIMSIALPRFKTIQKLMDKLNLVSRESLTGMTVIRAFSTQDHEKERFDRVNKDLTEINLFVNRVMVFMMPAMTIIMNGVTLLVIWVGAHQIAKSAMQVGDMMAFMQYAIQIVMAFLMMSLMFILVPRAAVSAQRIAEVLETENTISDPETPKSFDKKEHGILEFKNVHFRYQGAEKDALSNISFVAKPGQTTAIIGSTGSGKSTIANLALRFYDVSQGQILVNGVDIREVTQKELRSKIGYVPQKGILLSGTVASNIKYGNKNTSDEEMENAAAAAQALEFISENPERFNADISQGGTNVSGGQKQRLSIARALAKNPEIFIFDDSFSALDFKTDAALRESLKKYTANSTSIVVAQRVSTIMHADQIIVLNEGRITGCGSHGELLKNCPEYYEIASSQLSKEELT